MKSKTQTNKPSKNKQKTSSNDKKVKERKNAGKYKSLLKTENSKDFNEICARVDYYISNGNIYFAKKFAENNNISEDHQKQIAYNNHKKIIDEIKKDKDVPNAFMALEILKLFNCNKEAITDTANIVCKYYIDNKLDKFADRAYAYLFVARLARDYELNEDQFIPFAKNAYREAMKFRSNVILNGWWPKFAEKVAVEFNLGKDYIKRAEKKFIEEIGKNKK
ncbi:MAG: hypothetical protein M1168_01725 [Candidatus Marsarchaeota archaeon]|nr:hypothetical protein [Candidatus Marsarchaeota archaeon]MCL5094681.1 hypothetical protein [Candidatus Marsarchaeota archaeon]